MSVPEEEYEPARLQPGRFVARRHRLRVMILVHDPSLSLWHYRPLVPNVTQAHLPSDRDSLDSSGRRATRRDRAGPLMPQVECDTAVIPSGIVLILVAIVAGMVGRVGADTVAMRWRWDRFGSRSSLYLAARHGHRGVVAPPDRASLAWAGRSVPTALRLWLLRRPWRRPRSPPS
jgi:hypothetical protein